MNVIISSIIITAVFTLLITVLILRKLIPVLKSKKMGQPILEIGPRWHKSKEGTPAMGGVSFIAASVVIGVIFCVYFGITRGIRSVAPFILTLTYGVICGLIGCIDDLAKLRKGRTKVLKRGRSLRFS